MNRFAAIILGAVAMTLISAAVPSTVRAQDYLLNGNWDWKFCLSGWITTISVSDDGKAVFVDNHCEDFGGFGYGGVGSFIDMLQSFRVPDDDPPPPPLSPPSPSTPPPPPPPPPPPSGDTSTRHRH